MKRTEKEWESNALRLNLLCDVDQRDNYDSCRVKRYCRFNVCRFAHPVVRARVETSAQHESEIIVCSRLHGF